MKKHKTAAHFIILAIAVALLVVLFALIPLFNYVRAVELYNESRFQESWDKLMKAGGYRNSSGLVDMCGTALALEKADVGDTINFGKYEQNGFESDGSENISWIILEKGDSEALLISKNALDAKPYNSAKRPTIWANSSLRKWLNGHFLQNAFNISERSMIAYSDVNAHESIVNVVDSGNDTKDLVYLLSLSEFEEAFPDRDSMRCGISSGVLSLMEGSSQEQYSCWLRSSGYSFPEADVVTYYEDKDGGFSYTLGNGFSVDTPLGIRPVIRLVYGNAASPGSRPVLKIVFGKGIYYSLSLLVRVLFHT